MCEPTGNDIPGMCRTYYNTSTPPTLPPQDEDFTSSLTSGDGEDAWQETKRLKVTATGRGRGAGQQGTTTYLKPKAKPKRSSRSSKSKVESTVGIEPITY